MERLVYFGLLAAALGVLGFLRWKLSVKLFFVLVVLDGAIRKWIFPEAQQALYFLKDALLIGVYMRFWLTSGFPVVAQARLWTALNILIVALISAEAFNPELPSVALGLVGWKSYVLYVPLVFVIPYLFESFDDLLHSVRRYSLLALPVILLAVLQFLSGADSALNTGLLDSTGMRTEQATFHEVERVRVAGPFPFVSGFTAYVTAMLAYAMVLLVSPNTHSRSDKWIAYLLGSACVIGMFMSGSRAPVVTGVAMASLYLLRAAKLGVIRERHVWAIWLGVGVAVAATIWILPEALDAWMARTSTLQSSDDPIWERILLEFTEVWRVTQEAGIFGYGAGATHNAAGSIIDVPGGLWSWLPTIAEGEMARVILELGVVGGIMVYGARLMIITILWKASKQIPQRPAQSLLVAVCALLIVQIPSHIMINPVANAYYYGAIGLAFAVIRLCRQSATADSVVVSQPQRRPSAGYQVG